MLKKLFIVSLSVLTVNYNLYAAEPRYPLHEAAQIGDSSKLKELLKHCDINEKDDIGMTPLHYAAFNGDLNVVQVLLADSRCNINEKDDFFGSTPLHIAINYGHHEIVQVLLADTRCNINEKDNCGKTPLDEARLMGKHDIEYLSTHWNDFIKGLHMSWCKSILAGTHPRCDAHSPLRAMPCNEMREILSYLRQGTCIYRHEDIARYVAIAQQQLIREICTQLPSIQQQQKQKQQGHETGWCTIN